MQQFMKFAAGLALVLCSLGAGQAQASQLLTNGGFEDGIYSSTIDGHTNDVVPVAWTPNAGFDLEPGFNLVTAIAPHSGVGSVSISNYDYEPLATLSQTFQDVVGATYLVSFYGFDGGTADPLAFLNVSVGRSSAQFDDSATSYQHGSFTFTGTGSDTLVIGASTNPNEWYVDDLSVSDLAGEVPEPATWGLLLVGLTMIGAALRQRSKLMPA